MTDQPDNLQIEEHIRDFVARNLLYNDTGFTYADDMSFLQEGIIDSLGVLELVEFTQKTFGLRVGQQEVTTANFDSVAKLAAFVRQKQADAQRTETSSMRQLP
ncbi:MAG TPA: acyl carrier protein [Terracidiphilus sp.]|nr:acyl carrier protein [Terracidiphilus sp.]